MSNKVKRIEEYYKLAKEKYAELRIDTEEVLKQLDSIPVSMHCWQGDDVKGFENPDGVLTGGIQATGNHPGKARTPEELRADLEKAFSLIPGKKRVNLHAIYLETKGEKVDRDQIEPKHFENWVNFNLFYPDSLCIFLSDFYEIYSFSQIFVQFYIVFPSCYIVNIKVNFFFT